CCFQSYEGKDGARLKAHARVSTSRIANTAEPILRAALVGRAICARYLGPVVESEVGYRLKALPHLVEHQSLACRRSNYPGQVRECPGFSRYSVSAECLHQAGIQLGKPTVFQPQIRAARQRQRKL